MSSVDEDLFECESPTGKQAAKINSEITGLSTYLSAGHIRKKIKHPVFLALRFDLCISIYFDSLKVSGT